MDRRSALADCVAQLYGSKVTQRAAVQKAIVLLWDLLPVDLRKKFLAQVDAGYPYDFIRFERRFPDGDEDLQLESAARSWGYVMPTLDGRDRDFGRTVERLIRMRKTPSAKQQKWMLRLYQDWKRSKDLVGEVTE